MLKSNLKTIILEVLNEENILIPRRLEGRRELYIKKLKAMLQQKHLKGDLDLRDFPEITDLGNVETISGDLNLYNNKSIKSLGNLTSVGGYLYLYKNQSITSLGNLTSVGGFLDVSYSKVTSLENLTSVGRFLDLGNSKVSSLGKLQKVGNVIYIDEGQFSEELLDKYKKLFPGKIKIWKNDEWEILK